MIIISAGDISLLDVDFYTIEQTMLSNKLIRDIHILSREVWVWTVNGKEDAMKVLSYNIDGIISDYPEKIKEIITINTDKNNWDIIPESSRFSFFPICTNGIFRICSSI